MKAINILFLSVFITGVSSAKAQTISGIALSVDTSTLSGSCPHKIKFNAVITSAGQLKTVNLVWDKNDGSTVAQNNVTLSGKGNDTVSYEWLVNSNFNGLLTLHVNTASIHKSSTAIHFKSKCK
ncbi:hypothetical protein [Ferruginibacter sp. SUN106]|uniref:hypothetical protein n=1 Tax=Ferruginibacter sp. SUN106 TaxID=2978348 RepID=UPI003D361D1C